MERKLFFKGKLITSDYAHELSAEDKVWITARKPVLEEKLKKVKEVKK